MALRRFFVWIFVALFASASNPTFAQSDSLRDLLRGLRNQIPVPAPATPGNVAPTLPVLPVPAPGAASVSTPSAPEADIRIPPVGRVPLDVEIRLGRQIAGNLLGAAPLVSDSGLQAYVNRVGRWIALHSERADLQWFFGVIESDDLNAFAAPGGYVFITRGLYARLPDEAALAGVLAHEIAHVQERHHLKVLQKSQAVALGARLFQRQAEGAGSGVQRLIGSGAEVMARGLDKEAEFEADRIGVVLAARAGYDPWGLPVVLQDLSAIGSGTSAAAMLFKTHPHPDDRLSRLAESIGDRLDQIPEGASGVGRLHPLPVR